ncbi:MAG TPA: hypothetical protein VJ935_01545 [Acidimicrobiia bacterium]|nr:hypothetical protein [Acidimicrobiia bacterium]
MNPERLAGILGLVLYLGVGFFYLTSGLVVPFPWLALLWVIWLGGLVWAVLVFRARPPLALLFAPLAFGFWFLFVTAGERFLGWTG